MSSVPDVVHCPSCHLTFIPDVVYPQSVAEILINAYISDMAQYMKHLLDATPVEQRPTTPEGLIEWWCARPVLDAQQ